MANLTDLTISEMLDALEKKETSSVELTQAHLDLIDKSTLNAFSVRCDDIALSMANASDERRAAGNTGLIEGIPIGVKDLFCTNGVSSTACSNILKGFVPTYESTVTSKLFAQGGVMVGKTNMDEFAMGSGNLNSAYGEVANPWKRQGDDSILVPGGSSGGSSAAVAARLCPAALGTDTGGSVRQPAAFTGTVGIKPTYGRCSRYGMIAFASSLDQAGVFARNVKDAAVVLESICGHDQKDSTSANQQVPHFREAITGDVKGLKIGIPKEYHAEGLSEEIDNLWKQGIKWLEEAGAEIIDISLPHTHYALPTYYIIAPAEASSNLARYDGVRYGQRVYGEGKSLDDMYEATRSLGFGDEVKRRIILGTYVLSAGYYDAYYTKAQKVRTKIIEDFRQAFSQVDAILTPATPTEAFAAHEEKDPVTMYLNDVFTVPASLAGLPAMTVPAALSQNGLPLGLQIIGPSFDENTVFRVGDMIERQAQFNSKPAGV